MKCSNFAAQRILDGMGAAEAVNVTIKVLAKEMLDEGVPSEVIAAFLEQYLDFRPTLMADADEIAAMRRSAEARSRAPRAKGHSH